MTDLTAAEGEATTLSTGRQGVSVIAVRLMGAGLGLAAQVFASRMVGADDFGRYSLLLVWLLLLGHSASMGMGHIVYRFLAQYLKTKSAARAAGLMRYALYVVLGTSVLVAVLALAALHIPLFHLDSRTILLGTLAFLAVPLLGLQDFLEAVARGIDKPNLGIAPAFLLRHMAIIAGLCGLFLFGMGADALWVMGFTIAGFLVSVVVQYLLLRAYIKRLMGDAAPDFATREWTLAALPMTLGEFTQVLFLNADVLILGLFVPPDQVAFYYAATRLAQLVAYVPYGISAVTAQKFAALAEHHERPALQALIGKAALAGTVLTLGGTLFMALLAGPLLGLFGAEFGTAQALVPLLCMTVVVTCVLGPGQDVLNMLGGEREAALAFTLALVVNIALNFLLIPLYGTMGAALAGIGSLVLRGLMLAYFAWARFGLVLPVGLSLLPSNRD